MLPSGELARESNRGDHLSTGELHLLITRVELTIGQGSFAV